MKKYEHIVKAFRDQPFYLMPEKIEQIAAFLELKAAGGTVPPETVEAIVAADARPASPSGGGNVAVLPLVGIVSQRVSMLNEVSGGGGASTQKFTAAFRQAMADDAVRAVVIDVDSPGGSVYGVDELASEIFSARGGKPIVAVANSLMASAAYYIGSAADEVIVTPGGEAGSIGVVAVHEDWSVAYDAAGVKATIIKAGKYKWEANDMEPLTDDAQANIQKTVDRYYEMFVRSVARGRKTSIASVRNGFGEGRVVGASEAVKLNMADGVGTLDQVINLLASGRKRVGSALAAEEETPSIESSEEQRGREDRLRRLALGV